MARKADVCVRLLLQETYFYSSQAVAKLTRKVQVLRGGRFKGLKKVCCLSRPGPRESPKSDGKGGPGRPRYRRTAFGNHWISKSGWGTGWAPGQNAYSQYKMPSKGPPRLSSRPRYEWALEAERGRLGLRMQGFKATSSGPER